MTIRGNFGTAALEFELPERLVASVPPETRGLSRDGARLMVHSAEGVHHSRFNRIGEHLTEGDALVVNVSATMPYALEATSPAGLDLRVHLSVPQPDGLWSVEVRTPAGVGSTLGPALQPQTLRLEVGGQLHLLAQNLRSPRLWMASLEVPGDLNDYLARQGRPIRYGVGGKALPLHYYQTVFASEPGSAEMPSAARPFTNELVVKLLSSGVMLIPIVLHSGVSSFETGELPGEERYRVPSSSAVAINALRSAGGRVIAVGTTSLRALETVADPSGVVREGSGYTDLVIGPGQPVHAADGLLTGWHEPGASHLQIIEAVAGVEGARRMYDAALATGYLWHEFGDSCLILR